MLIFLSDHGMPLPFAKTQLYHHSTRTPLMVRIPGVTENGKVEKRHMVSVVDLLPTVLETLGIDRPARLDGRSFYPALRGEKMEGWDYIIKQYHENSGRSRDPMRAIQTKTHLYLFNPWSNGERIFATATNGPAQPASWVRCRHVLLPCRRHGCTLSPSQSSGRRVLHLGSLPAEKRPGNVPGRGSFRI